MLNFRELINWLDNNYKDWESIMKDRTYYGCDSFCTPLKYEGIYKRIGRASVWNDVGSIELDVDMYVPVEGGTVLYDVDNAF